MGLKTVPASLQGDSHGSTEWWPAMSAIAITIINEKRPLAGDIWTHISSIGKTSDTAYFGDV